MDILAEDVCVYKKSVDALYYCIYETRHRIHALNQLNRLFAATNTRLILDYASGYGEVIVSDNDCSPSIRSTPTLKRFSLNLTDQQTQHPDALALDYASDGVRLKCTLINDGGFFAAIEIFWKSPSENIVSSAQCYLRKLLPHLRTSVQLSEKLRASRVPLLDDPIFEGIRVGLMLIDAKDCVVGLNQRAYHILSSTKELRFSSGSPLAINHRGLCGLIDEVRTLGDGSVDPSSSDRLHRLMLSDGREYIFRLALLSPSKVGHGFAPDTICIWFDDPGREDGLLGIKACYGLTDKEESLCQWLVRGLSLQHISERMSISRETAKSHLKNVFYKTQTHRQPELVSLLLQSNWRL